MKEYFDPALSAQVFQDLTTLAKCDTTHFTGLLEYTRAQNRIFDLTQKKKYILPYIVVNGKVITKATAN